MSNFKNYVNGEWTESASGETFENVNPADSRDIIGTFPKSGNADVAKAIEAASTAYKVWSAMPAPKRGDILRVAGDIFNRRKDELARVMTREMGKPVFETKGDIQEAIDTAYYSATETRRLFGYTAPSEMPNKMNLSFRMPIGVCGIITAWNFPIAVPSWKILPALACGNTIVWKPSEDSPMSANIFAEILEEAGVPKGVFNVIHGLGETGSAIVEHPDVKLIGFTGSTVTGKKIAERCGALNKKVSLEMGGKNAVIIMNDADIDLAIEGVLWGAFGTTGQRCTATSRAIVHKDVYDIFLQKLTEKTIALKLGAGLEDSTQVGPVINKKQYEKILGYIEIGKEQGARLSVSKANSYSHAIELANDCEYGLSSSIYTSDVNLAFSAIRSIEAGITYINAPTIGAEAHMPFGGIKGTGNGHREGGWTVFDIFTEWKTVYIDYSGGLQRAQIDNY